MDHSKTNKKESKKIKRLNISSPISFEHRYHVSVDDSSCLSGIPSQWRKDINLNYLPNRNSESQPFSINKASLRKVPFDRDRLPRIIPSKYNLQSIFNCIDKTKLYYESAEQLIQNSFYNIDHGHYSIYYGSDKNSQLIMMKLQQIHQNSNLDDIYYELKFLSNYSHLNIIHLIKIFTWNQQILLLFHDDNSPSLYDITRNCYTSNTKLPSNLQMTIPIVSYIAYNILLGLEFIHSKKYLHRDIKPENILISPQGNVKIAEFGVCIELTGKNIQSDLCGSQYWLAPEMVKKQPYSFELDIWSFGCTIYELVEGLPPHYNLSFEAIITKMYSIQTEDMIPANSSKIHSLFKPFLQCCFAIQPNLRLPASLLLLHPFLINKTDPLNLINIIKNLTLI